MLEPNRELQLAFKLQLSSSCSRSRKEKSKSKYHGRRQSRSVSPDGKRYKGRSDEHRPKHTRRLRSRSAEHKRLNNGDLDSRTYNNVDHEQAPVLSGDIKTNNSMDIKEDGISSPSPEAYIFTRRNKEKTDGEMPAAADKYTITSTVISTAEVSHASTSPPAISEPVKPIPMDQQLELFKWMLEEKRKVKTKDPQEKKKFDEEKALLKQFIRAKSNPSL